MKREFKVFVTYADGSEEHFAVTFEKEDSTVSALLMMITRGTFMASSAKRAICYNDQGFEVCAYEK